MVFQKIELVNIIYSKVLNYTNRHRKARTSKIENDFGSFLKNLALKFALKVNFLSEIILSKNTLKCLW